MIESIDATNDDDRLVTKPVSKLWMSVLRLGMAVK
jgi:hypothetical protein